MRKTLLLCMLLVTVWGFIKAQNTMIIPISSSTDDAEELSASEQNSDLVEGDLDLASSDLELVDDASWNGAGQTVGIRFNNVALPGNAVITDAYIVFTVDDDNTEATTINIKAEENANSATFANTPFNISSRPTSVAGVEWTLPKWPSDSIGTKQNSPSVKNLVEQVLALPEWKAGNAITFIITGTGERETSSFDKNPDEAAILVIEYEDIAYEIEQVKDLPSVELVQGWDFSIDLSNYFVDQDSPVSYEAVTTGTDTLPSGLTLVDGILDGTHNYVGNYNITVTATSDGKSIDAEFPLNYMAPSGAYTLAIFHNNDGESDMLPDSITVHNKRLTGGSIGQFKNTLDSLRSQAETRGYNSIMLSSGDNFLAGLEYNASQANGVYYDAIALDSIDYDAICLGNHDFDFGTSVLAEMINAFETNKAPYLSANLGFENTPELQTLVDEGRISPSTIIEKGGQKLGIIGLTTPLLPTISSPGNTIVSEAIVDSVQKQVGLLEAEGVNKIILISHLQNYNEDIAFAAEITGVDIIIAGGGDELLANDPDLGKPFNTTVTDAYPVVATDKDGKNVYLVTTPGNYRYLGNLLVDFDANGEVTKVYNSDPVLVYGDTDEDMVQVIEAPIQEYIGDLSTNIIAQVEDTLDYLRETLRGAEANGGNLFADAILWQAQKSHADFGVKQPTVAIQNSGGLRIESLILPGDFTEDLTYEIAAFTNIVSVVEDIAPEKFMELIEHGVANAPNLDGRFPQISGFKIHYYQGELEGTAGVKSIELNDGTLIVAEGEVVEGAPDITLATIDFTANGGDGYPFSPLTYTTLGATYQQAFKNFLTAEDGLNGVVSESDYPFGETSRITFEVYENPAKSSMLLNEDFNGCDAYPIGWIRYSVSSNADWDCSGDGNGASGEAGDYVMEANGYGADAASEDWLITPKITLDGSSYALNFNSMVRYSGPALEVLISHDYAGSGDPNLATWTVHEVATAAVDASEEDDFVNSGDIDLEGIEGETYIAFKYTSTGTGGGDGAVYRIDDVMVKTTVLLYENFNKPCEEGELVFEGGKLFSLTSDGLMSCSSEGFEDSADDFSVRFNGYGVGEGEAWMITPMLALGEADYVMTFASKLQYSGPAPIVVYSTDYKGVSDPNEATWTEITEAADAINGSFNLSPEIDLGFINEDAYIAFKYISEGGSGGQSVSLLLDELTIKRPEEVLMGGKVSIAEIQGNADESPLLNNIVTTWGVVTATFDEEPYIDAGFTANLTGFFLQDPKGDDDETTSEGILIYTEETVSVGDSIDVTGLVAEMYGMTELKEVSEIIIHGSETPLPETVQVTLPMSNDKSLEQYEGMLVNITNEMTVTENRQLHTYGQVRLSASGLLQQVTQVVDPYDENGNYNATEVDAYIAANDTNSIMLDDASNASNTMPIPFIKEGEIMVAGTKVNNLIGILAFDFGMYRIYPTAAPTFTFAGRDELPDLGDASLKVATFNVLNYFNGNGDGTGFPTSRGASTVEEFTRQAQKIVAALAVMDADVVGLIEIENDADETTSAMKSLVDSLNAAIGTEAYDFVKTGEVAAHSDGYADEIKVGFIYKTATVELVGDYAILNNAYSENFNDQFNRPAVAQTFKEIATNEVFTTVVNHLKSKGSDCDEIGDPNLSDQQGNCNGTRTKATATMVEWLATDPTGSTDPDFLILGDLNAYAMEDPIDTLLLLDYINLVDGNFSYVYDGQYGTLDYALANQALNAQVTVADIWHINSLEPVMLAYNGLEEAFVKDAYSSSDHDPVLVGLKLSSDNAVSDLTLGNGEMKVYPNPFQQSFTVQLQSAETKLVTLNVYNALGAKVESRKINVQSGSNAINLTLTNAPNGVYTITIDELNQKQLLLKAE